MMNSPLVQAVFTLTGDEQFTGWHRPDVRWNGWATPTFDRSEAERIVAWTNTPDGASDTETFSWHGDRIVSRYEDMGNVDVSYIDADADGRYPIGSFGWVWSEVEDEQDEQDEQQTDAAVAAAVEDGKREILADIADGTLPADVADFSSLHDHVDANGYAGFFDARVDWTPEDGNRVTNALDAWLRAGRP